MLQNVKYNNVDPDVVVIFEAYFSNNKVTMGTLCRKIKRILASLATISEGTWEMTATCRAHNVIFIEIWNTEKLSSITIDIQPIPAFMISESIKHADLLFKGNSTNPKSKGYSVIEYPKENLKYTLYNYPSTFKLFYLCMEYTKPTFWTKLIRFVTGRNDEMYYLLDECDDINFRRTIASFFN